MELKRSLPVCAKWDKSIQPNIRDHVASCKECWENWNRIVTEMVAEAKRRGEN